MSKRYLEEVCKAKLDAHLKEALNGFELSWLDGSEPPDYWLEVGGTKYAVEMTSIVDSFDIAGEKYSEPGVDAALWSLVADIDSEANQKGILFGTYIITFHLPVPNLRREKRAITKRAIDYTKSTATDASPASETLWDSDLESCVIKKVSSEGKKVYPFGPGRGAFESQAAIEACKLLKTALFQKKAKLRNIQQPIIIVIHDLYALAPREAYYQCHFEPNELESFVGIYISVPDGTFVELRSIARPNQR